MAKRQTFSSISGVLLLALAAMFTVGCDGSGGAIFVDPPDNSNGNDNSVPDPVPDGVTVRLLNVSELALDVQLFISTDPAITTEAELFVPEHEFRDGIGFLSLGILDIGEGVDVELACSGAIFIGTRGGEFLDHMSGTSVSTGERSRLAQLGPQFDCGNRVTLRFSPDANGSPIATLSID